MSLRKHSERNALSLRIVTIVFRHNSIYAVILLFSIQPSNCNLVSHSSNIKPRVIPSMRCVGFRSSTAMTISDGINWDRTRRMSTSMLSSACIVKEAGVHEYEIEYGMSPFVFRVFHVDRFARPANLACLISFALSFVFKVDFAHWRNQS